MGEGFDSGADTSIEVTAGADIDTSSDISVNEAIEPINDIPVEVSMPEQEITELQNEAEALAIEPLVEEVEPYEPSALSNILTAGASGAEPGALAQIGGEIIAPPGAGEAVAQGLQMGANAAIVGSGEFIEATINQHGRSPSVEYNEILIQQAIDEKPQGDLGNE